MEIKIFNAWRNGRERACLQSRIDNTLGSASMVMAIHDDSGPEGKTAAEYVVRNHLKRTKELHRELEDLPSYTGLLGFIERLNYRRHRQN